MHHQHRRADLGDALAGVEALRDQRPQRQPAEPHRCEHIGHRREAALDHHAGLVIDFGRQVDRDRAAQRMAVDQPLLLSAAAGAASPTRRERPRRRWLRSGSTSVLWPKPAIVDA